MAKNTKRGTVTSTTRTRKSGPIAAATLNGSKRKVKFTVDRDRSLGKDTDVKRSNQHVVPHDGAWAVRKEGSNRATLVFEVKRDAIDTARRIAQSQGAEIIIHGRSGQVFQRSNASSSLSEKKIRDAIRSSAKRTSSGSSTEKKSSANDSSRSRSNKQ